MRTKPLELKSWLREYRWFMLLEGLLAASIFFVDLSMELGVAGSLCESGFGGFVCQTKTLYLGSCAVGDNLNRSGVLVIPSWR